MKIKHIKKKQQTHEDHNEEETTKALGRSNHEDQTQTANIKQGRLNPNNENRFQTTKIKPRRRRRLNPGGEGSNSGSEDFIFFSGSLGLLMLLRFLLWSLGLLKLFIRFHL